MSREIRHPLKGLIAVLARETSPYVAWIVPLDVGPEIVRAAEALAANQTCRNIHVSAYWAMPHQLRFFFHEPFLLFQRISWERLLQRENA
jgi:hypothetical protein